MFKYYKNDKTGEIRIVRILKNDSFVVVKYIDRDTSTVKFWRGDLENTERFWNTKPFCPDATEMNDLIGKFYDILRDNEQSIHFVYDLIS